MWDLTCHFWPSRMSHVQTRHAFPPPTWLQAKLIATRHSSTNIISVCACTTLTLVCYSGTSNQTRAYGQYYNSLPADGPEVMTLLYPDTAAGNSGLCRHLAFQQVMPNNTLLSNQSAGELAATATYTRDPTSHIFHSLGNITNPVLVLGGTLDIRISIADLYTLVDYIPDASLVLLDSAGHESVQQYAITAGGIISDFLDEQSTPE